MNSTFIWNYENVILVYSVKGISDIIKIISFIILRH